jgi:hypothetical protein
MKTFQFFYLLFRKVGQINSAISFTLSYYVPNITFPDFVSADLFVDICYIYS